MKRIILTFLVVATFLFPIIYTNQAGAVNVLQNVCNNPNLTNSSACSDYNSVSQNSNPFISVLKIIMDVISFFAGVTAVVLIIISGFKFVTSGGDTNNVASARGTLINAVIGLIITAMAQLIVVFVLDKIS